MGVVYRARDTLLQRDVALKVLPAEAMADESRQRRFLQEARAASALNHPHIVTIYDVIHEDGVNAIVMELIAGTPATPRRCCAASRSAAGRRRTPTWTAPTTGCRPASTTRSSCSRDIRSSADSRQTPASTSSCRSRSRSWWAA